MKALIGLLVALAVVVTAGPALATDNVAGTKHNLSTSGTGTFHATSGTGAEEVCVFCHTPHWASSTAKPLWNRTASTATFTMYNSSWSSTIDETVDTTPGGVSAACLSCHAGDVAFDSLLNRPGSGTGTPTNWTFTGGTLLTGVANLGNDLTNDHPISITYRTADTAGFNAATAGKVGSLPLYTNKVECGSCHNPHESDTALVPFLRISNASSNLCRTCHIK